MIIPSEVKCKTCAKVFCCSKCREKHEIKMHPHEVKMELLRKIDSIDCAICRHEPFILQPNTSNKLLSHISQHHLPLHCTKCLKVYSTNTNLLEFSKCTRDNTKCKLEANIVIYTDQSSKNNDQSTTNKTQANVQQSKTTSTQTSPYLVKSDAVDANESVLTPIINVQWKTKHIGGDGSLTDSASSINVSTNNNNNNTKSIGTVVRTTSTPMQTLLLKMKGKNFDSSSCQVSSIHSSSSESEVSPPVGIVNTTSSSHLAKPDGTLAKSRGRGKMPVAATPLRQVMSKSIQRAIAEHRAGNYRENGIQPKKIFDSLDASSSLGSPVDLRTSPVLRRTQSEIIDRTSSYEEFHLSKTSSKKAIFSSTKHVITEDVIITSLSSKYEKLETVYETCRSIETSLCDTTGNKTKQRTSPDGMMHLTPKFIAGNSTSAKCFETPHITENNEENDDVFYTPTAESPKTYSKNNKQELTTKERPSQEFNSKLEKPIEKENCNKNDKIGGKFWSVISSVIRLASFGSSKDEQSDNNLTEIKRCASFAGTLTRSNTAADQSPTSKRKRTNTVDSYSTLHTDYVWCSQGPSKRLKRITGRKPIERMRKQSEKS